MEFSDHSVVRQIYFDAVESQKDAFNLYSVDQIKAWSALAWLPGVLDRSLIEGNGWVSCESESIEAFAVRYPLNRLSLLYCRGRATRKGHATRLLRCLESDAFNSGQKILYTEASLFSYPLLLRCGWKFNTIEKLTIGGVFFERYLMEKQLE